MKRFTKVLAALMLTLAVVVAAGCKKPDDPTDPNGGGNGCNCGGGLSRFTINVSANPTEGGTVSGGGTFDSGASRTVTATANEGYSFKNWTENGSQVSTNANYTFTVNSDRDLVANFLFDVYRSLP